MTEQEIPSPYRQDAYFWFNRCNELKSLLDELSSKSKEMMLMSEDEVRPLVEKALGRKMNDGENILIAMRELCFLLDERDRKVKQMEKRIGILVKNEGKVFHLRRALEEIAEHITVEDRHDFDFEELVCMDASSYETVKNIARQALEVKEIE